MRTVLAAGLVAIAFGLPISGEAASTGCPQHFAGGQAPDLLNPNMTVKARELCFTSFGVLHSGLSMDPIYSAEHLTAANINAARRIERPDSSAFHYETNLPAGEGPDPRDYTRSGYDRGHMSPSGDMPDGDTQYDSFSMANMVPQDPDNNRHLWEQTESVTRQLAIDTGEVYVVTGPIFQGSKTKYLNGKIAIPTGIFKAVYIPSTGQAAAYVDANAPGQNYQVLSITQLQQLTGLDVFPALPQSVKDQAADLPPPHQARYRQDSYNNGTTNSPQFRLIPESPCPPDALPRFA